MDPGKDGAPGCSFDLGRLPGAEPADVDEDDGPAGGLGQLGQGPGHGPAIDRGQRLGAHVLGSGGLPGTFQVGEDQGPAQAASALGAARVQADRHQP